MAHSSFDNPTHDNKKSKDSSERKEDDMEIEEGIGEQIRVSFVLDPSVADKSLEVPSEAIAVPAALKRKGLSAVINHLLNRKVVGDDEENKEDEEDGEDDRLPSLPFDFLINEKLLRTGVEIAARRYGLSLEQTINITYFPAQQTPEESGKSEPVPDWVSTLAFEGSGTLVSGGYDGSIRVHVPSSSGDESTSSSLQTVATVKAHSGPIKCLSTFQTDEDDMLIVSGSLDQSLVLHRYNNLVKSFTMSSSCIDGHISGIGCVHLNNKLQLLSGDMNGGISIWKMPQWGGDEEAEQIQMGRSSKKQKSSSAHGSTDTASSIKPLVSWSGHGSQVSNVFWIQGSGGKSFVSGSWDHSVKVWDVESQDCLLTLNGARVVSCMDMSPHSEVVATGHPDCTIRLWDIRTAGTEQNGPSSSLVSDSTLKPSHKAWVSAVQWSPNDPYCLASGSHDGTLKIWDIRSSLPLHTVRTHPKDEKSLCLAFGHMKGHISIFVGGTDGIVKHFSLGKIL